ncbi:MAG: hypothetical protein KDD06_19040 [Phaeodactylibacter sp.]|nr:hypothetical protein [Phaeodactylibacter sp.]
MAGTSKEPATLPESEAPFYFKGYSDKTNLFIKIRRLVDVVVIDTQA